MVIDKFRGVDYCLEKSCIGIHNGYSFVGGFALARLSYLPLQQGHNNFCLCWLHQESNRTEMPSGVR